MMWCWDYKNEGHRVPEGQNNPRTRGTSPRPLSDPAKSRVTGSVSRCSSQGLPVLVKFILTRCFREQNVPILSSLLHSQVLQNVKCVLLVSLSCSTFVNPWTVARQAPLSWDSPGKNTGVGCHSVLQEIFPIQGLNLRVLHRPVDSLPLSYQRSPALLVPVSNDCTWSTHALGSPCFSDDRLVSLLFCS